MALGGRLNNDTSEFYPPWISTGACIIGPWQITIAHRPPSTSAGQWSNHIPFCRSSISPLLHSHHHISFNRKSELTRLSDSWFFNPCDEYKHNAVANASLRSRSFRDTCRRIVLENRVFWSWCSRVLSEERKSATRSAARGGWQVTDLGRCFAWI